jgi:hypothetical protein
MVLTDRETNYAMIALGQRSVTQETAEANGKSQLDTNVISRKRKARWLP